MTTTKCIFDQDFASTLPAMGEVLLAALAALREHACVTDEQEFAARLCLEEALVNAVTHGNCCDESCRVRLDIEVEDDRCRIRVRDEGAGFDPRTVVLPDCEQEGGRGVCIIRHYMDHVEFEAATHCLIMEFRCNQLGKGD